MHTLMFKLLGAGSSEYCVVPGNKKPGCCKENVKISASHPASIKALVSLSSNDANPPLRGCAGPIMTVEAILS